MGVKAPCGCLVALTDAFGISSATIDRLTMAIMFYLLSVSAVFVSVRCIIRNGSCKFADINGGRITRKCLAAFVASAICGSLHAAEKGNESAVRIVASGSLELVRGETIYDPIETWNLTIYVRKDRFRLIGEGVAGLAPLKTDIGFDGMDTFVVIDATVVGIPMERGGKYVGFAYEGRFVENVSIVLQAAWLAYCSDGFFTKAEHARGLKLSAVLNWTPPENITNVVARGENGSIFPAEIHGWSRNWVHLPGTQDPVELKHYPRGFKVWETRSGQRVAIDGFSVPREVSLKGFAPRPPETAESGTAVTLTRRVQILARSVEVVTWRNNDFLPDVPIAELTIDDRRFVEQTGDRILVARASPPNNWPTRGKTDRMKKLQNTANAIAAVRKTEKELPPQNKFFGIWFFLFANVILVGAMTPWRWGWPTGAQRHIFLILAHTIRHSAPFLLCFLGVFLTFPFNAVSATLGRSVLIQGNVHLAVGESESLMVPFHSRFELVFSGTAWRVHAEIDQGTSLAIKELAKLGNSLPRNHPLAIPVSGDSGGNLAATNQVFRMAWAHDGQYSYRVSYMDTNGSTLPVPMTNHATGRSQMTNFPAAEALKHVKNLNSSSGTVTDGALPAHHLTLTPIWLAYHAAGVYQLEDTTKILPPWLSGQQLSVTNLVSVSYQSVSPGGPFMAACIFKSPGKVWKRDQTATHMVTLPPPYDNGYKAAEYTTLEYTNVSGLNFPQRFQFTKYRRKPKAQNANDLEIAYILRAGVTNIVLKSDPSFEAPPKLTPSAIIGDRRQEVIQVLEETKRRVFVYRSTNGNWATVEQARSAAQRTIKPAGNATKGSQRIGFVILAFAFVSLLLIVILNRKQQQTSHT